VLSVSSVLRLGILLIYISLIFVKRLWFNELSIEMSRVRMIEMKGKQCIFLTFLRVVKEELY